MNLWICVERKHWNGGVVAIRDPEVSAILAQTRLLTLQAKELADEIGKAVDELAEFVTDIRQRRNPWNPMTQTYAGPERRRGR